MELRLEFDILPQPDGVTCGPTCLDAVYRYYGDALPHEQVIAEVPQLASGGTLAVHLACHALRRGYQATLYTYNLQLFDPTWFPIVGDALYDKLKAQLLYKDSPGLHLATQAYLEYLDLGGKIRFADLTLGLMRKYLMRRQPILTGLSATFLYREAREFAPSGTLDDVRGNPAGHFVVLCGFSRIKREVLLADPLHKNPMGGKHKYWVKKNRLIASILLGIVTHDANLLVLKPPKKE